MLHLLAERRAIFLDLAASALQRFPLRWRQVGLSGITASGEEPHLFLSPASAWAEQFREAAAPPRALKRESFQPRRASLLRRGDRKAASCASKHDWPSARRVQGSRHSSDRR